MSGKPFFEGAAQTLMISVVSFGFASGIGSATAAISSSFLKAGVQAVAHGVVGGVMAMAQGGKFIHGFVSTALGSVATSATMSLTEGTLPRILSGGVTSGLIAELQGGNFYDGFRQGIIVAAFNHLQHEGNGAEDGGTDPPSKLDQIAAELVAMKARLANLKTDVSNGIEYTDSALDAGGLGVPVNIKSRMPMGYKGESVVLKDFAGFRFKYFGSVLTGKTGYYTLKGLNLGGGIFSGLSVANAITSSQSLGWKLSDITFTGLGVFGGHYGTALSLSYNFGFKPVIQAMQNPSNELYHSQIKYCNNRCR